MCVQPSLLQILMPPLQEKWASIPDTDRELQPLFECFTSLATALGMHISPQDMIGSPMGICSMTSFWLAGMLQALRIRVYHFAWSR